MMPSMGYSVLIHVDPDDGTVEVSSLEQELDRVYIGLPGKVDVKLDSNGKIANVCVTME